MLDPNRFQLEPKGTAVAVVDVQERLLGAMPPETAAAMVRAAEQLVRGAHVLGLRMVVTEQYPKGLGSTVGTLREALGRAEPIAKLDFDCTRVKAFVSRLRSTGIQRVVLSGMEAHICVLQTAAGLLREGFEVWVGQDAICSRAAAHHQAAVRLMSDMGAVVAPVESILFLLLGRSGSPAFKEISRLIK